MPLVGFLNLHKPPDMTSHDCVAKLRKIFQAKQVGHGGTLDPKATGVLPIAISKATRLLNYLPENKAYQAVVRFGVTTSTDDLEGEIIKTLSYPEISLEALNAVLPSFIGRITQIPPIYSAIHQDGKRLYELARQGKVVEVPSRQVDIFSLDILAYQAGEFPELTLNVNCGPGTYIRSLARDLGEKLGSGATLAGLIRTKSCGMSLDDSLTFTEILTRREDNRLELIPPRVALQHIPLLMLTPEQAQGFCQGKRLPILQEYSDLVRVEDEQEKFLGMGVVKEGVVSPKVVIS
jgi:tRNA pseudouridine55 synthase